MHDGVTSCSARSTRRLASRSSSAAWASSFRTRATLSLFRTCQLFFGRMFIVALAQAKQEHHQEEEGGGGGAKRLQCWPTIMEECDLRRKMGGQVEEEDKLEGVDERQQRAKQSSSPNHSLTINQSEHPERVFTCAVNKCGPDGSEDDAGDEDKSSNHSFQSNGQRSGSEDSRRSTAALLILLFMGRAPNPADDDTGDSDDVHAEVDGHPVVDGVRGLEQHEAHAHVVVRPHLQEPVNPVEDVLTRRTQSSSDRRLHGRLGCDAQRDGEEGEVVAHMKSMPVCADEHGPAGPE
ncbi:hypothetical protein F7725_018391, partial [Dissostichus mawsoni]